MPGQGGTWKQETEAGTWEGAGDRGERTQLRTNQQKFRDSRSFTNTDAPVLPPPEVLSHWCGWDLADPPQVGLVGTQGGNHCSNNPLIYRRASEDPRSERAEPKALGLKLQIPDIKSRVLFPPYSSAAEVLLRGGKNKETEIW